MTDRKGRSVVSAQLKPDELEAIRAQRDRWTGSGSISVDVARNAVDTLLAALDEKCKAIDTLHGRERKKNKRIAKLEAAQKPDSAEYLRMQHERDGLKAALERAVGLLERMQARIKPEDMSILEETRELLK